MKNKLNMLGLARRAGKLIVGTNNVIKGIQTKKVLLVFLANDAAINTTKQIEDKCKFYNIPLNKEYTSNELNKAIGFENIMTIGVIDYGFYNGLK